METTAKIDLDVRECLRLVLDEYALMVIMREEEGDGINKWLPLFDRMIKLESIVCNILGIDGDTIVEYFKKNKLIVEDTLDDLMVNYYGVKKD